MAAYATPNYSTDVNGGLSANDAHLARPDENVTPRRGDTQLVSNVRVDEHTQANPGPLGMFGFAITIIMFGFYICGVGLPGSNPQGGIGPYQVIFGVAVFSGGMNQIIAAVLEYSARNTFGATVHGTYGAFWLSFAMLQVPSLQIQEAYKGDMRAFTIAIGIYLMTWALITLLFDLGALRTNYVIVALFTLLMVGFFLLSVSSLVQTTHTTASPRLMRAGGVFAILSGVMALWAGIYGLYEKDKTWIRVSVFAIHKPKSRQGGDQSTNGSKQSIEKWHLPHLRRNSGRKQGVGVSTSAA